MAFYGKPEYLAYLEINLNLARDPDTSAETMAGLRQIRDEFTRHSVEVPALPERHRSLVFESLRGLILSHHVRNDDSLTPAVDGREEFEARAQSLIDALAGYVAGPGATTPPG